MSLRDDSEDGQVYSVCYADCSQNINKQIGNIYIYSRRKTYGL